MCPAAFDDYACFDLGHYCLDGMSIDCPANTYCYGDVADDESPCQLTPPDPLNCTAANWTCVDSGCVPCGEPAARFFTALSVRQTVPDCLASSSRADPLAGFLMHCSAAGETCRPHIAPTLLLPNPRVAPERQP